MRKSLLNSSAVKSFVIEVCITLLQVHFRAVSARSDYYNPMVFQGNKLSDYGAILRENPTRYGGKCLMKTQTRLAGKVIGTCPLCFLGPVPENWGD